MDKSASLEWLEYRAEASSFINETVKEKWASYVNNVRVENERQLKKHAIADKFSEDLDKSAFSEWLKKN